ncbi:MAG: hypothetical protein ABF245_09875, partial [Planktotalea arctica]
MSDLEMFACKLIEDPTNISFANQFINKLQGSDGLFRAQEDDLFDYKKEFPHSMSDSYFAGICRIIFGM